MVDALDILDEFPPRLVLRHQIRKSDEPVLEPFDFFIVEDWQDMRQMCSDSFRYRDLYEPDEVEDMVRFLNPVPLCCNHGGDGKYTYEGSTFVMLPYTADVSFEKLMNVAAKAWKNDYRDTHGVTFGADMPHL